MWGWGRNNKEDDSNSNNYSTSHANKNITVASSPRSPISLGGATKNASYHGSKQTNNSSSTTSKSLHEHSKQRRRSWGGKDRHLTAGELLPPVTIMEKGTSSVHLSEVYSGIEVSLSQDRGALNQPNNVGFNQLRAGSSMTIPQSGAISLPQQLADRQKVYRAQFQSVHSIISSSEGHARAPLSPSSHDKSMDMSKFYKPRDHRLPLFESKMTLASYDETLALLKGYVVKEEAQCVQDEIDLTESEISSIEKDRGEIEQLWVMSSSVVSTTTVESKDDQGSGGSSADVDRMEWDISRTLATRKNLPFEKIKQLQRERGVCLTVSIENSKTLESLLAKCGGKATTTSTKKGTHSRAKQGHDTSMITTVRPSSDGKAIDGGDGATSIQNVTLIKCPGAETSFFLSRDMGSAFYHGRIPDRMYRRMKNKSVSSVGEEKSRIVSMGGNKSLVDPILGARELSYVSTGPFGCYYCEFRSEECWWGLTADDDELDAIFNEWDVYKIAFGPYLNVEQGGGKTLSSTSWIVIARDGRAAWKNLPSRLHNKLSSRLANESLPYDVSLGCGGSYFIRFLDGTYPHRNIS
jgi:hypothetical protein